MALQRCFYWTVREVFYVQNKNKVKKQGTTVEINVTEGGMDMCYVCGRSSNKIVHSMSCRYVKLIPEKNRKIFSNLKEASEAGYVQCKYCAHIVKYLRSLNQGKLLVNQEEKWWEL